jgi:mRNA interferase MazF
MRHSVIYDLWGVVLVPFPFTDRSSTKRRPALILSRRQFNDQGHTVLAMITTQSHDPWPGDTRLENAEAAGLHTPCIARMKLFTLDNRLILKVIGCLTPADRENVTNNFGSLIFCELRGEKICR